MTYIKIEREREKETVVFTCQNRKEHYIYCVLSLVIPHCERPQISPVTVSKIN